MKSELARLDSPIVFKHLFDLTVARAKFRGKRLIQRLRSPRRMLATLFAVIFFGGYVMNAIFILSARDAADPQRLSYWLSGGMVIYILYHIVRCAWTSKVADLQLTDAEQNLLGGAPIPRSALAIYHINNVLMTSAIKTFLLVMVIIFDVPRTEFLVLGVFSSIILLETLRLAIDRWSAGLSDFAKTQMKFGITAIVGALAFQVFARLAESTPLGSPMMAYIKNGFSAIGDTASCSVIQYLAIPWHCPSQLSIAESYSVTSFYYLSITLVSIPLAIFAFLKADQWASGCRLSREKARFEAGKFSRSGPEQAPGDRALCAEASLSDRLFGWMPHEVAALISRQAVSIRRYRMNILFSFLIPLVLCLSPLLTGRANMQWFFVIGGVALCTILLAPPALKLDFRRDLRRILLLRGMPIKPLSMVIGQLALPILITLCFQWVTLLVAALVIQTSFLELLLWTGLMNALAVFAFAMENALFLAYPHHEHSEGIAMLVRAKLTFLGKGAVIGLSTAMLFAWAIACKSLFSGVWIVVMLIVGSLAAAWTIALIAIAATAWCWKRFDLAYDVPPQ